MADAAAPDGPGGAVAADQDGPRLTADSVLERAPDAASERAARGIANAASWAETGSCGGDDGLPAMAWGLARGRGSLPYRTAVEIGGSACQCTCPSRKFPCKHALGLLLRWVTGEIANAPVPGWVREWHAGRVGRAAAGDPGQPGNGERAAAPGNPERAADPGSNDPGSNDPGSNDPGSAERAAGGGRPGERAVALRAERVAAGLEELDRWLADQARTGVAGLAHAGYAPWDAVAARLIDAKAPAVAGVLRRLPAVAADPDRLVVELGLLHLLARGYRRIGELPDDLAETIRMRVGIPVPAERVLAEQPPIRDAWRVVGVREEHEEHLLVRRVWLLGERSGRPALVLGFAGPGQALSTDLRLGTRVEADLCFYPGAQPLRALVAGRHAAPEAAGVPAGGSIAAALAGYAAALARDPWLERWPVILSDVVPVPPGAGSLGAGSLASGPGGARVARWHLAESDGTALPIDTAGADPWRLVGAAAGKAVTIAGEWSVAGLRPLTVWTSGRLVRL
jgi:SWIM zinc finger